MTNVRHFADRVLRLKAEQDELSGDIKEVYAEAKASGFDKTLMGQLVAFLRKREKDPHKVEESSALFDLYLHAYDSGTPLATRAHAHETDIGNPIAHDPSTGELIEELGPEAAAVRSGLGEASPASGDVVEINASPGAAPCDASPNDSDPASDGPANSEDEAVPAVPVSSSPLSGDDPGEMPTFLKRGDPECIVRAA
jgi:uncharacterized protein (UPF0335 family)